MKIKMKVDGREHEGTPEQIVEQFRARAIGFATVDADDYMRQVNTWLREDRKPPEGTNTYERCVYFLDELLKSGNATRLDGA